MSYRRHPEPVEDYTRAFLVSFGVLIFILLFGVMSIWGFIAALLSGWAMDRAIVIGGTIAARRRDARIPERWR